MVPAHQPPYTLRLLGGFRLERDGTPLTTPHSVRRLLAYLAVHGACARAQTAGTLWPSASEERARASLRTVLWRVHRLAPEPLVTGDDRLALAPAVDSDVAVLTATAGLLITGAVTEIGAAGVLTGELLPGWYDDWVLAERERLRQLRLYALEALAARFTAQGRFGEATQVALTAVHLEPLRESATRALIAVHLAENNINEAVRRLALFRTILRDELGVTPTRDLERLVHGSTLVPT